VSSRKCGRAVTRKNAAGGLRALSTERHRWHANREFGSARQLLRNAPQDLQLDCGYKLADAELCVVGRTVSGLTGAVR
jgi:hypothetical protein